MAHAAHVELVGVVDATPSSNLADIQRQIENLSKANFLLARDLHALDERIRSQVRYHTDATAPAAPAAPAAAELSPRTQSSFESLFTLLKRCPHYLGLLAPRVDQRTMSLFVQTVVFDMFGDQWSAREEQLLLQVFRHALRNELAACDGIGSFLRRNSAVTQMVRQWCVCHSVFASSVTCAHNIGFACM
jgi:Ras GTPase-activating-like protein IQGAP2/3